MALWNDIAKGYRRGFTEAASTAKPFIKDLHAGSSLSDTSGYVSGRFAGDVVSNASRIPYWRFNAAQAVSDEAGKAIGKRAGLSPAQVAIAGFGVTQGMELASGNIDLTNPMEAGRPKGYSALYPQEIEVTDPETGEIGYEKLLTKSRNPVGEVVTRYFLGRTGSLLPYDELVEERPDVSPEEYQRFQNAKRERTLFGLENASRTKAGLVGGITGGLISAATKGKINPLKAGIIGTSAGIASPDVADLVSESGLLQGTRESIDDPVGEVSFFGYRVPIAKGGLGTLAGAGLVFAGAKGLKTGRIQQVVNRGSRKVIGKPIMAPVEFQQELPFTYGGPRVSSDIPTVDPKEAFEISKNLRRRQLGLDPDLHIEAPPVPKNNQDYIQGEMF